MAKRESSITNQVNADMRVVVLTGKDSLLRLERSHALEADLKKQFGSVDRFDFDGTTTSLATVLDELRMFGLLATHKLVIVDNAEAFMGSEDRRRAMERFRAAEGVLAESAAALKVPAAELPMRLAAVIKELKELKKSKGPATGAALSIDELLAGAADISGTRIVVADARGSDAAAMRQCIDQLRRKASPIAVFLGSSEADKVTLVAGISRELEERGLSAGNWIKDAAAIVGGKGGGRSDLAQAGGKLVDKLPDALTAARKAIEQLLKA